MTWIVTGRHYLIVYADCGCIKTKCACASQGAGQWADGPNADRSERSLLVTGTVPGSCPACEASA